MLLCSLLLWSCAVSIAQAVRWYAEIPARAYTNSPFEVRFTLENGKGKNVKFPSFQGLEILSGPSVSNQFLIINGNKSSNSSYTFTVNATKKGIITIGGASIEVDGKTMTTQSAVVQIKEPDLKQQEAGKSAFVRLNISEKQIYKGQQLTLKYELYFDGDIGLDDVIRHPSYNGFAVKTMESELEALPGIQTGDRNYEGVLVETQALFAKNSGNFKIGSSIFPLKEKIPNNDPWAYPFGRYKSFQVKTDEQNVEVRELPLPYPDRFNGVTGSYTGNAQLAKASIGLNQTISVRVEISGNGDPTAMRPPLLKLDSNLESYPPKLLKEENFSQNHQLYHRHVWEIPVTAKAMGDYDIHVLFNYFDPETKKYTDLNLPVLKVNVTDTAASKSTPAESTQNNKLNKWLLTGILLIGVSLALWFFITKKSQTSTSGYPAANQKPIVPNDSPQIKSQLRYNNIRQFWLEGKQSIFYTELGIWLHEVLQEQLNLSKEAMTISNITECLNNYKDPENLANEYADVRKKLDMALYAGATPVDSIALLDQVRNFINIIQKKQPTEL